MALNGGGWRSVVIGTMSGALVALVLTLLTIGRSVPTRQEVSQMIRTESPYATDRETVVTLKTTVGDLTAAVNSLRETQARTNAVLDRVLDEHRSLEGRRP